MEGLPLIDELAIIAAVAVAVTVVLARFHLPTVAGLLLAGALVGPFGFGLATSVHSIEVLAEVGVVLLLFSIGLEFSLERLRHIFKQVAFGGLLQVGITTLVSTVIATLLGQSLARGVFYGFVLSLSSTAIVLRALTERGELDAPHGRFIVGTLIFQDLCVVPMLLLVPFLGPVTTHQEHPVVSLSIAMAKAAAIVVATLVLARWIVPRVLAHVDQSKSREVFLLAILALCIGTAWLTSLTGLSLALGAFLAGMLVADTEYGHRAMGDVLPLRDAFVSVFFVSLGMLFDARVVVAEPLIVLALLAGFILIKGALATVSALVVRFQPRAAWLAGVGLAQFGEFGFVLVRQGTELGVVDSKSLSPLLASGIISMFLTPILIRLAPQVHVTERLLTPLAQFFRSTNPDNLTARKGVLENHVVVVGFGLAGRFATKSLQACNISHVVIELNAASVRAARQQGVPVYYGDATQLETLRHARLQEARALVLLMNDAQAAQRVVNTALRLAPNVPILMRAKYLLERDPLIQAGARDVVAEEVEGAVEVIARLLRWVDMPRNVIDDRIRDVRAETQSTERKMTLPRPSLTELRALDDLKIETYLVREGTVATQRSRIDLDLRKTTGALVVSIRRGDELLRDPDPNSAFIAGDRVYLVGTSEAVNKAIEVLSLQSAEMESPIR